MYVNVYTAPMASRVQSAMALLHPTVDNLFIHKLERVLAEMLDAITKTRAQQLYSQLTDEQQETLH